ncbi:potassium channel subfamily K member 7 [Trichosurus vulpecula]|uniref:potassium channel subfamily K member 7 n=1 Tax=Trichosurus vulpecula TaxID=9337 RepID=UPI00186ACBBD|nr:potassium channel subfamily K member 7 [Trichosurus vulpecula]
MGPGVRYWLLLACYLAYLLLGSAVFMAIEGPPERRLREQLLGHLVAFQADHQDCLSPGKLEVLLEAVLRAQDYGVSALGNATEPENWDFASALFFAVSVLTTTGYGHRALLSDGGKAFCVGFAGLGLPAGLVLVAVLHQHLLRPLRCLVSWVATRCGLAPARIPWLQASLLNLMVGAIFVLLPALVLWSQEDHWSLLDACYFCFMSLSTIGLGDLVPGQDRHPALYWLSQLAVICYLLLGLLALLLTLETVSELKEIQAVIGFFSYSGSESPDDQRGIVTQDVLTLSNCPPPPSTSPGTGHNLQTCPTEPRVSPSSTASAANQAPRRPLVATRGKAQVGQRRRGVERQILRGCRKAECGTRGPVAGLQRPDPVPPSRKSQADRDRGEAPLLSSDPVQPSCKSQADREGGETPLAHPAGRVVAGDPQG